MSILYRQIVHLMDIPRPLNGHPPSSKWTYLVHQMDMNSTNQHYQLTGGGEQKETPPNGDFERVAKLLMEGYRK